ncbi:MAG: DUF6599 family protein [Terracidiphilus sp.]
MRWIFILVGSATLAGSLTLVHAQNPRATSPSAPPGPADHVAHLMLPPAPAPQLPPVFAGWVEAGAPKTITNAAQADPAHAAALQEYGMTGATLANYQRDGETLTLRALRFPDASGAYGAYSFYRQNGWPREEVGTGAASNHSRVLFWKGNIVVDANFSHAGPMSAGDLRNLASQLTVPLGNQALAPPILADLPTSHLEGQTTHYALGPAGYAGSGGVLPPGLVGFDRGAEILTANYQLTSGEATLTIINYPTPQMAEAEETKIRDYIQAGKQAGRQPPPGWTAPLANSDLASLEVGRNGPLVALVSGDAIPDESHRLLALVHYDADFISIPHPADSQVVMTGKLLVGIAFLVIIGASTAILLGFFLGGFRALYRMARGKPASSLFDAEFIRLNLRD